MSPFLRQQTSFSSTSTSKLTTAATKMVLMGATESLPRETLLKSFNEDWEAKQMTYEELKPKTLHLHPETYIIDVREPEELLTGSIPTAVNLPLSDVLAGAFLMQPEAFKEKFGYDKPEKDHEVIIYCKKGKRSSVGCDSAKKGGYTNIAEYKGSWLDWVDREGIKWP